jgi:hypothetical protein
MKIELISEEEYNTLLAIQERYPVLTFQNNGYEYVNNKEFNEEEEMAYDIVTSVLNESILGFKKFNNFKKYKNDIVIRFQYNWTAGMDNEIPFIGVGYLSIDILLKGFGNE